MAPENERCWVLVGSRAGRTWCVARCRRSDGKPASVEADWAWTLSREERRGDVLGFVHTHPRGAGTTPSERDARTMRAWCSALGKPLLCIIADGPRIAAYVFPAGGGRATAVPSVGRVPPASFVVRERTRK